MPGLSNRRDPLVRSALRCGALLLILVACGSGATLPPAQSGAGAVKPAREPLPADIVARSALPLHAERNGARVSEPELWDEMAGQRAVCLGEQHDSPAHHYAQRRAIEELAQRGAAARRSIAVGFEMFQTPYQPPLSAFVEGTLPEAEFLTESDYRERWGFDFALYRPLLEAAREHHLPALALNAPRELTRQISRAGLDALEPAQRAQLPQLDLANPEHRAYFDRAMSGHPMPAGAPKMDDMYAVQVVWDETMAETSARWLNTAGPDSAVIVLAGSGHCHHSAIPGRLGRRLGAPVASVSIVLQSQLAEFTDRERYDWLLVLEDAAAPAPSASAP
jgi:uncharacterized iron-regulated protein